MLRSTILDKYKKKTLFEKIDSELIKQREDYLLNKNRPFSEEKLKDLSISKLNNFVDEYLLNEDVGKVLFSSNSQKEIENFAKSDQLIQLSARPKKVQEVQTGAYKLVKKKTYIAEFKKMSETIDKKNLKKKFKMGKMKKENLKFYKDILIQKENRRILEYKPMNDIRLKNFNRIYNNCTSFVFSKKDFKLPSVALNINDVFSRLYHNRVYLHRNQSCTAKNSEDNNKIELGIERFNSDGNNGGDNVSGSGHKGRRNSSNNFNGFGGSMFRTEVGKGKKKNDENENMFYNTSRRKQHVYNLKNVIKSIKGKEFTSRINKDMLRKCIIKNSCGPKRNFAYLDELLKNNNAKKNDLIIMKDYVDENGNTYLHNAVIDGNEKLVKYFIEKKVNVNKKNKFGETPLHLAMGGEKKKEYLDFMLEANIDIIKLLLNNGADLTIKNNDKERPFDLAPKFVKDELCLEDRMRDKNEAV